MSENGPIVIRKNERMAVYALAICVDLLQIILDFFVIGLVANRIIDVVMGGTLLLYSKQRKILTSNKALVLAATFVGEQIPIVDALPLWTLDVRNIYSGVMKEIPPPVIDGDGPLNQDGARKPERSQPLNQDGVRHPQPENTSV